MLPMRSFGRWKWMTYSLCCPVSPISVVVMVAFIIWIILLGWHGWYKANLNSVTTKQSAFWWSLWEKEIPWALWRCTCGGVYLSCFYSHARWSDRKRLRSVVVSLVCWTLLTPFLRSFPDHVPWLSWEGNADGPFSFFVRDPVSRSRTTSLYKHIVSLCTSTYTEQRRSRSQSSVSPLKQQNPLSVPLCHNTWTSVTLFFSTVSDTLQDIDWSLFSALMSSPVVDWAQSTD